MEVKLYVRNLDKSTTTAELNTLFAKAGEVMSVNLVRDRNTGESKGFAFITMSAQSEADKAVSLFHAYSLSDQSLYVNLAKPRVQRGFDAAN